MLRTRKLSTIMMAFLLVFVTEGARAGTIFASTQVGTSGDNFGTLDTTTGVFTGIGNNFTLAGIGALNGVLYGAARADVSSVGTLYSINTLTGAPTIIGNSGNFIGWLDFAATSSGLWAIGSDNNLYSINATTGAATLVGATGVTDSLAVWSSLSSGTSGLFLDVQDNLYSVNTATGAATFVGCGGSLVFSVCSGPQMAAMGGSDATLYGIDDTINELYTVNTGTGVDTASVAITGNFAGHFTGLSLAPTSVTTSVPEPVTISLFGAGIAGAAALRRRRKRV